MSSAALKKTQWPGRDDAPAEERTSAESPAPERLIAEEPEIRWNRRGPMRPTRLTPSRSRLAGGPLAFSLRLADWTMLGTVAALAIELANPLAPLAHTPLAGLAPHLAAATAMAWALGAARSYAFKARERVWLHGLRVLVAAAIAIAATFAVCLPFAPAEILWQRLSPFFVVATGLALAGHLLAFALVRALRRAGRLTANIVVVGAGRNAERLIEGALASGDVNILGVFDDRADRAPVSIRGVPVLGATADLLAHRIMPSVDKIVIAVPSAAQSRVRQLVERLSILPNPIALVIDAGGEAQQAAFARIADSPLAFVSGRPNDARRALVKRAQDLVIASIGLVLVLPIMGLVALAIRLDSPGPIFFRQRRHGFNNEEIVVWKFRSMRVDASDARAERQVSKDDDRVTRVGRFIRKTSLDELPQIFNVLSGEMSLVGPRPHAIGMKTGDVESARLVAEYAHRHRMKPGITGWAAIKGSRGPVDTPEAVRRRVALDVEYIERQSFWLDLYIILMTIPCLLGDSEVR